MTPAELVSARRLLICVGGGGVGKTTVSAALGLLAAGRGRRALVLTIDPARRLASALGLDALDDRPRPVAPGLDAMMLDRQRAWQRLVERHAPSPAVRERLLANRLYRELSQSFAGAHEYLALEEVAGLSERGDHDLIVVDTPPARHAFDFLEAPARLSGLVDRRFARWLLSSRLVAAPLEAATGRGPLAELADFFAAMGELFAGFVARAGAARALLAAPMTGLVLVASADPRGVAESEASVARLHALGLRGDLLVANRVHRPLSGEAPADLGARLERAGVSSPALAWIADNYHAHARLAAGETERLARLAVLLPLARVPRLGEDVHDRAGLAAMARHLAQA